jgi:primosomal protein N'
MMEDFVTVQHLTEPAAEQRALLHIQSVLEQSGMSVSDFGLPQIEDIIVPEEVDQGYDVETEQQQAEELRQTLTEEQSALVDRILQDLNELNQGEVSTCRAYYLEGPGGSGKTRC